MASLRNIYGSKIFWVIFIIKPLLHAREKKYASRIPKSPEIRHSIKSQAIKLSGRNFTWARTLS